MMTLDEAIKHAEEVADTCEYEASKYDVCDSYEKHVAYQEGKCAEEHKQLAEWLKELKALREQKRPHGEWNILQKDDNGIHEIECPFCKYSKGGRFASVGITFHKLPPFCEACGADMREGETK